MNDASPLRLGPGIHAGIHENEYHRDPAPEPSASASILRTLWRQSPEHAREKHPRLNPTWEPSASTDAQDAGKILHWEVLQSGRCPYRPLDFKDFRTDKAKAVRDETRAVGLIPILEYRLDEILAVARSAERRIERNFPELHAALRDPETQTEATIIYRLNGVMCRSRIDVLPPRSYGFIADLKFTGLDAPPDKYMQTVKRDYRFQADMYPRAVEHARGDLPAFRFFTVEEAAPFGASVYGFGPGAERRNRARVDAALAQWAVCLQANEWPSYSTLLNTVEDEAWEDERDNMRVLHHGAAASVSTGVIAKLHRIAAEIGGPIR